MRSKVHSLQLWIVFIQKLYFKFFELSMTKSCDSFVSLTLTNRFKHQRYKEFCLFNVCLNFPVTLMLKPIDVSTFKFVVLS